MSRSLHSAFWATLLFTACGDADPIDNPDASAEADAGVVRNYVPGLECPPDSVLSYDGFGGAFLGQWCLGCHSSQLSPDMRQGAPLDVNFDMAAGVNMYLERMAFRATGDMPTMPPVGGPPADQRQLFSEWLSCGAPGTPASFPDAGAVDPDVGILLRSRSGDGGIDPLMGRGVVMVGFGTLDVSCPALPVRGVEAPGCCHTDGSCGASPDGSMAGAPTPPEGMVPCLHPPDTGEAQSCAQ